MGVQSAINQGLGAIGGAVLAGKKISEAKENKQISDLKEEASLANQANIVASKIEETQKGIDENTKKLNDKRYGEKKRTVFQHDLEVYQEAMKNLGIESNAIATQRALLAKRMGR